MHGATSKKIVLLDPRKDRNKELLSLNDQQKVGSSISPLRHHTGCVVIRQVGRYGESGNAVFTTASE